MAGNLAWCVNSFYATFVVLNLIYEAHSVLISKWSPLLMGFLVGFFKAQLVGHCVSSAKGHGYT